MGSDRASAKLLAQRERAFRARTEQYRRCGHDRFAAARFVAEAAGNASGVALDVGTGKGLLAMALAARGFDVVSVDIDAEDQELAAALSALSDVAHRIRFLLHDAASLPFPDGHFSIAAMMDVLHHLEDATPVLGEMARLVGPQGRLVIADFIEEGFELVRRVHQGEGRRHPRSDVTLDTARDCLALTGWTVEDESVAPLHRVARFVKQ
jgi:ubiquinone/menaquinone biosynthesis C-methylase UbiE